MICGIPVEKFAGSAEEKLVRSRRQVILVTSALIAALSSFTACEMNSKVACNEHIPSMNREVLAARQNFQKFEGRSLAGQNTTFVPPTLSEDERTEWMRWSRDELMKTQRLLDVVDGMLDQSDSELVVVRQELSQTADQLVRLHAYSELGLVTEMSHILREVQDHSEKASKVFCREI